MRAAILSVSVVLVGCGAPPVERDCTAADETISGQITAGQTAEVVAADLTVRGTTTQSEGHVVRRVLVAGIAATNTGFNFEQWSAVVPIGVLAGLPAGAQADLVKVEAVAIDGCDQTFPLDDFDVTVDRTPGVRVDTLALTAEFPGNEGAGGRYLPADGSASALIRVTANPEARGAAVTLGSNVGTFEGVDAGNVVHLAGDGQSAAMATVFLTADRAQDAIVTAHAKTVTSPPLAIDVAGAPTLVPSGGTLGPSDKLAVTVFTDGNVSGCQATPAAGLRVLSNGADLMAGGAVSDTNGDGRVDILVTAAAMVPSAVESIVTCRDRYDQRSTGTFRAAP